MMTELPYHCPEFRSSHLKPPCAANLAKIQAPQQKWVENLGTLEICRACQGEKLITREAMEERAEEQQESFELPGGLVKLAKAGTKRTDILTALDRLIKREGSVTRRALAEELQMTVPALGYYLTKLEQEDFVVITPGETPTSPVTIAFAGPVKPPSASLVDDLVPEGIGITAAEIGITEGPPLAPAEIPAAASPAADHPPDILPDDAPAEIPLCKVCGVEPEKIDRTGRKMGICSSCMSKRSQANLKKGPKYSGGGFMIPLHHPKYEEIKQWLQESADDLEQSLPQQIMYQLKLAYRAATAGTK